MADRTPRAKCGTLAGCSGHYSRGEKPCAECAEARNVYQRWKRTGVGDPPSPRPVPACGTFAAYQRHHRLGEPTCRACRDAMNAYQKSRRTLVSHEPVACLFCGEMFTPKRKDNRGVCSPLCGTKLSARQLRLANGTDGARPCVYCETVFVAKQARTEVCSTECRNALRPFRQRGLHPSDYRAMLDAQGHACAGCGDPLGNTRRDRHIDHDHATGAVRGVLCPNCNLALGHALDSPERLRALADYLESHRARRDAAA